MARPKRRGVAYYGDDFWVIAKKGFGAFIRDCLVRLNGDRLKVPTLFELIERPVAVPPVSIILPTGATLRIA